ncbi:hypothetical protein [Staphylococcus capitis]|uniref:hypothetical protein n=1 Tax=Staphylococcus capitis TaxID=29388 RepID=UPI0030C48379
MRKSRKIEGYSKKDSKRIIKASKILKDIQSSNKGKQDNDIFTMARNVNTEKDNAFSRLISISGYVFLIAFITFMIAWLLQIDVFHIGGIAFVCIIILVLLFNRYTIRLPIKHLYWLLVKQLSKGAEGIHYEQTKYYLVTIYLFVASGWVAITILKTNTDKDILITMILSGITAMLGVLIGTGNELWINSKLSKIEKTDNTKIESDIKESKIFCIIMLGFFWFISMAIIGVSTLVESNQNKKINIKESKIEISDKANKNKAHLNTSQSYIMLNNGKVYRFIDDNDVSISKSELKSLYQKGDIYHIKSNDDKDIEIKLDNGKSYELEETE